MIPVLKFDNRIIGLDDAGMWSLTDMWAAAGASKHQRPADWIRQSDVQVFISAVERQYHDELKKAAARKAGVQKAMGRKAADHPGMFPSALRQQSGRVFAYWQIALAYAKYLSPQFHMWCNEIVRRYLNADPELVEDMFDRMPVPDQRRTLERLRGIEDRHRYTDVLKAHGVSSRGYGLCTEALQQPILGMSTREAKQARGVAARQSIREVMTTGELATTRFAEQAATARITGKNVRGDRGCMTESARAGRIAALAFDQIVNGD
jgi:hypothetical protein